MPGTARHGAEAAEQQGPWRSDVERPGIWSASGPRVGAKGKDNWGAPWGCSCKSWKWKRTWIVQAAATNPTAGNHFKIC